jgi:DNA-directed RNA polymerase specialized sigma24 family protein
MVAERAPAGRRQERQGVTGREITPMTASATEQLLTECEPILRDVVRKTGLARFAGGEEDALQHLRSVVVRHAAALAAAPPALRWTILYRSAVSCVRRHQREARRTMSAPGLRKGSADGWAVELLGEGPDPMPTPEQEQMAREALAAARRVYVDLTPAKQRVLLDRIEDVPSEATGRKIGVSGSRVRQLWREVIDEIRRKI